MQKKLASFIAGKMLAVKAGKGAGAAGDALSKDQLKQMFEATKLKRQHAAEARGVRMAGRTGDLDVTQVDKMQRAQMRSQVLMEQERQVDYLVFKHSPRAEE